MITDADIIFGEMLEAVREGVERLQAELVLHPVERGWVQELSNGWQMKIDVDALGITYMSFNCEETGQIAPITLHFLTI